MEFLHAVIPFTDGGPEKSARATKANRTNGNNTSSFSLV